MKLKIKKSYKKPSDTFLLKIGARIKESMKNNLYIPNPIPTQAEVEKAYVDFEVSLSIAGRNDRTLSSAKNDKKAAFIAVLSELDDYIITFSNGDKTMLLSSGFDIAGIRGASQELEPIDELDVEIGPTGQAITRVSYVAGARIYVHQCTPDPITPDSVWTSETTTERENTFTNLNSVARYWFRVIAYGRGKQMVTSLLVSRVIQ